MLTRTRFAHAALAGLLLVGIASLGTAQSASTAAQRQKGQQAAQQQSQQQAQQQQQRLAQMEQALQKTQRIRDRLHQIEQDMTRDMDRIRDQDRLREHQAVRDMGKALGQMANNLTAVTLQLRDREREHLQLRDPQMQQDMERLHEHVRAMGTQLEDGLKIMERLQQRLRVLQPGS